MLAAPEPTRYTPGTREKLLVMADRVEAHQQVLHPDDATYGEDGDGPTKGTPLAMLTSDEHAQLMYFDNPRRLTG